MFKYLIAFLASFFVFTPLILADPDDDVDYSRQLSVVDGVADQGEETYFDYENSFRCSLQTSVFREAWYDSFRDASNFCGGFGEFSQFCQVQSDNGRYRAVFQFERLFQTIDRSFSRSRGRAFGQYYDFFTRHRFFGREYRHRWHFSSGCY